MRFIPVLKSKIKINEYAFLDIEGIGFGYGKLIERKETADGIQHTFKVGNPDGEAFETTKVKNIAVPKTTE